MNLSLKCVLLYTLLVHIVYADDEKYEMFCDKLEMMTGKEILDATKLKVEKTGPTNFIVSGDVEHFKEFNDDWTIALELFKSDTAEGEYRPLVNYPSQGKKGICTVLQNEYKKYFYDSIKECSTAPHFDKCPLKEAKYSFNKCAFDASVFRKFLSKGHYLIKIFMSHLDESNVVQYNLYAHVESSDK